jgi:hypothetical protein
VPRADNRSPRGFPQLIALINILLPVLSVAVMMILAIWLSASQIAALCPVILAALAGGRAAVRRRPERASAVDGAEPE